MNIANERYNQNGKAIDGKFRFNIEANSIEIMYMWGVFTNMRAEDMKAYMNDLKRLLAPGGKVFFTAFVEEDVPDVTINPKGYLDKDYNTPLALVRYNKDYLFSIISSAGLNIDEFNYGTEFDRQSEFYLS